MNAIEDVKNELNKAVKGLNNTVIDNGEKVSNAIADLSGGLEACTAVDCNNRGACLGTKKNYICACHLGYSGKNCEDTVCDSNRDCNGRGICLGTTSSLTCLCNLGFTGHRCERVI
ncbi:EGF-like domain protein [Oesophagostomum dentatum]|nr:EGF-like domain protein [Oesophagostomum dentatum]